MEHPRRRVSVTPPEAGKTTSVHGLWDDGVLTPKCFCHCMEETLQAIRLSSPCGTLMSLSASAAAPHLGLHPQTKPVNKPATVQEPTQGLRSPWLAKLATKSCSLAVGPLERVCLGQSTMRSAPQPSQTELTASLEPHR